eukprot:Partr_v1_DN26485_c1_g1_i2_m23657 putative Glycosyltransferase-like
MIIQRKLLLMLILAFLPNAAPRAIDFESDPMLLVSGCPEIPETVVKPGFKWIFNRQDFSVGNHALKLCHRRPKMSKIDDKLEFDVTLATFSTVDRIRNLRTLLEHWDGFISLAYYVNEPSDIDTLETIVNENLDNAARLTVHLMWAIVDEPFPINILRNIANVAVTTSHILPFDIDFATSSNARGHILKHVDLLRDTASGKRKQLLVLPALEANHGHTDDEHLRALVIERSFPDASPADIQNWVNEGTIKVFHDHCKKCQGSTDMERWFKAEDVYDLDDSKIPEEYEPYVITPSRIISPDGSVKPFVLWDEAFSGYGRDKTIYYYHLRHAFGYQYSVIPHACILHQYHEKSKDANTWKDTAGAIPARARYYYERVRWWMMRKALWSIDYVNAHGTTTLVPAIDDAEQVETVEKIDEVKPPVPAVFPHVESFPSPDDYIVRHSKIRKISESPPRFMQVQMVSFIIMVILIFWYALWKYSHVSLKKGSSRLLTVTATCLLVMATSGGLLLVIF